MTTFTANSFFVCKKILEVEGFSFKNRKVEKNTGNSSHKKGLVGYASLLTIHLQYHRRNLKGVCRCTLLLTNLHIFLSLFPNHIYLFFPDFIMNLASSEH